MKSSEIISHILSLPTHSNLLYFNETTNALKSLLGKTKGSLVRFAYERNDFLYVALNHPLGLQEFRHDDNISLIKNLLKKYIELNPDTKLYIPKEIRFFVAKIRIKNDEIIYEPHLIERAKGEFKNLASDEEIYALFEEIRSVVRSKSEVKC